MNNCIEWTGTIGADGYGKKWNNKKRTWVQAHRWVYESQVGPITDGMMIRHLCHNRKCVNPAHLEPGTMKDNRADDIDAGKDWFKGENNNRCIHNDKIIDEIYAFKNQPRKYGDKLAVKVAEKYGTTKSTVHRIWSGNYRHIKE